MTLERSVEEDVESLNNQNNWLKFKLNFWLFKTVSFVQLKQQNRRPETCRFLCQGSPICISDRKGSRGELKNNSADSATLGHLGHCSPGYTRMYFDRTLRCARLVELSPGREQSK